jgi:hypothetical protein
MSRLLPAAFVPIPPLSAQLPPAMPASIDQLVAKVVAESGTPTVSVAIIRDEKSDLCKGLW